MRFVYCRITVDGIPKEFSTKRKCKVSDWNQEFGRMEGNSQEAKSLNSYIDSVTSAIYNAKRQLFEAGKPVSSQGIKDIIQGVEEKKYWLMEIYRRYNVRARTLIGKDYVEDTVNRFDRIERYAQQFIIGFYKVRVDKTHQTDPFSPIENGPFCQSKVIPFGQSKLSPFRQSKVIP